MKHNVKEKRSRKVLRSIVVDASAMIFLSVLLLLGCSSDNSTIAEPSANMLNPLSSETSNIEIPLSYDQESSSSTNSDLPLSSPFLYQSISSSQVEEKASSSSLMSSSSYESSSSIRYSSSKSDVPRISGSYLIDNRDENKYKLITIGEQTWFAENLRYASDSSWCYANSLDSCQRYGRLYQWHSAMKISNKYDENQYNNSMGLEKKERGLCPLGWHLPNLKEWEILLNNIDSLNVFRGLFLKSSEYWKNYGNGYNTYGFNAYPAGLYRQGSFRDAGASTAFWSSIEDNKQYATAIKLSSSDKYTSKYNLNKKEGYSVRCIADSTIEGIKKIDVVKKVYGDSVEYAGHKYPTVVIKGQIWFAENLIVETDSSECPNNGNCANGRVYQWHSAMNIDESFDNDSASTVINEPHQGICPLGWHIPSKKEWDKLASSVIGGKEMAGVYLKSSTWESYLKNATNVDLYGFNFLPINMRDGYGYGTAYVWSVTEENGNRAYIRGGSSFDKFLDEDYVAKNKKYSVRCIKD